MNTTPQNPAGGSYNRVSITEQTVANPSQPASKFIEIGWAKQVNIPGVPNGDYIAVVYTDSGGTPQGYFIPRPQRNFHVFTIQYDPVIWHRWFVFEATQAVLDPNSSNPGILSDLLNACAVVAGGEAISNKEDMGNTRFYDLGWGTISSSGVVNTFFWSTNTQRLYQGRYTCTVTSITDHHCGP